MGSRAKKYLIASAVLAALALAGCPKKESPEDIEFAAQQAKKAAQEKKKKVDVFDEFYVDDAKKTSTDSKATARGRSETPAAATVAAAAPAKSKPSALPASSGSQNFSKNGRYVVQVSSTASESDADRMVKKLKGLGYPAYVANVQNPTPTLTGMYFRVRLGGFDNYSEAKDFAEGTLVPAGYDYWIDRKANDNVGIQGAGFGSAGGQQQYQPAPQQYKPAAAPQQYQPAATPQQYQPTVAPQPYQPAPAQQAVPTSAPAPAPAPQPAVKQQQAVPATPPPAPPPAAKPQQPAPAATPAPTATPASAPKPAAQPTQSTNDWGTTDDWGSADW